MSLQKLYQSIRFYFLLYGFTGGIKFALGLCRSSIEKIYYLNLDDGKFNESIVNPALRFRWITNEQQYNDIYKDYSTIKGRILADEDRNKVISGRELLGIVYKADSLAGWGWIKRGPATYCDCKLNKLDCLIHGCRTLRGFRRQGVYTTFLIKVLIELKNAGFSSVYIGAKKFNIASIKAIEKAGFCFKKDFNSGNIFLRIGKYFKRDSL